VIRRSSILAMALLAIGCSSHSDVLPAPKIASVETLSSRDMLQGRWRTISLDRTADPSELAADPTGYVWAVDNGNYSVSKVSIRSGVTQFYLSATPVSIAYGLDGNLWLTVTGFFENGDIVRLTEQGVETDFPVTSADQHLADIISGPDGALWFSQYRQNGPYGVGRVDNQGNYSFFAYPAGVVPTSLVAGPDGHIWFSGLRSIVEMSTQGQILAQYPFLNPVLGGTSGSDGNVWFCGPHALYRITTQGQITIFPAPLPFNLVDVAAMNGQLGLSANADGNSSFVLFDLKSLRFMRPVPGPHGLNEIIAGPDGNFWFIGHRHTKIYTYFNPSVAASP
jgi:virginiamycin B lyase